MRCSASTHLHHRLVEILFGLLLGCSACLLSPEAAKAQIATGSGESTTRVTAGVPDIIPPSIPILIAPSDTSILTTATPGFTWQESTDNFSFSHYSLYLDGALLFATIPTTATTNDDFTLTTTNNTFTLTPKTALTQGGHSWKIRANDTAGNTRDSATWSFSIDSQAPMLIIQTIGELTVTISAQDPDTIPDTPVSLQDNEPLIAGTTEPGSTLQLVITLEGGDIQSYTTTADINGAWSVQLPILPRSETHMITIQSTDPAGNITILPDVPLLIEQQYLFPTSPPEATTIPTPDPDTEPTTPSGPGESWLDVLIDPIVGDWPEAGGMPNIPIVSPKEILNTLFRLLVPQEFIESMPKVLIDTVETVAPVGSAVVLLTLPTLMTASLAAHFGWGFSLEALLRILQAIGLLPQPKPQGIVYDSSTNEPVPFAVLTLYRDDSHIPIATVVSNQLGVFGGIQLHPGKYHLVVRHQDYLFPSSLSRPLFLRPEEHYLGDMLQINDHRVQLLLMIPLDARTDSQVLSKRISPQAITHRLARLQQQLQIPLSVVSLIVAIITSSLINWLVWVLYLLIVLPRFLASLRQPRIICTTTDPEGVAIADVMVSIYDSQDGELRALLQTNDQGKCKAFLPAGKYRVEAYKLGYMPLGSAHQGTGSEVDATSPSTHSSITLTATA